MKKKMLVLLAVLAVAFVALFGFASIRAGQGGESSSTARTGGSFDEKADAGGSTAESPAARDAVVGDASLSKQSVAAPLSRAVISTGQVTVHTKSISRARAEVLRLVTSWDGVVADEQTNGDVGGRVTDSTMTLRVPTSRFSEAMNAMSGLGKVEQQSRKSEDVTTQVVDNDARIRAAERSIRQIESLLSRARQLSDIITIESDLARRQADLDSLKSQQAWLDDQTSLSTINVYLSLPTTTTAPVEHETQGFLAGLDGGWSALQGSVTVLLTVLGALLPFAVLAALLGVPLWLVVRRKRTRVVTPA